MNKLVKQAFTLIELLVVIAIIGILSGLIVVAMGGITQKATIAKVQVFSNSLRNSLMLNLIAEYKLDETSGTSVNDSWGGHSSGTISGATMYSSCIQNTCYSFSGGADYIELTDSPDLRMVSGGTISMWVYPKVVGIGRGIDKSTDTAGSVGYVLLPCFTNNAVWLIINGGGATTSSVNAITINQWTLVTATFNSSGRKIYVNGVDVTFSGGTQTALPQDISGNIRIGNRASATDRGFNGYIDELRIYNTVIPTSQIKEQYYAGLNKLLANGGITKDEYQDRVEELAIGL